MDRVVAEMRGRLPRGVLKAGQPPPFNLEESCDAKAYVCDALAHRIQATEMGQVSDLYVKNGCMDSTMNGRYGMVYIFTLTPILSVLALIGGSAISDWIEDTATGSNAPVLDTPVLDVLAADADVSMSECARIALDNYHEWHHDSRTYLLDVRLCEKMYGAG